MIITNLESHRGKESTDIMEAHNGQKKKQKEENISPYWCAVSSKCPEDSALQQSSGQSLHYSGWIMMVTWFNPQLSFSICWAASQQMQHNLSGISSTSFRAASWGKNVHSFFFSFWSVYKVSCQRCLPVCLSLRAVHSENGFLGFCC